MAREADDAEKIAKAHRVFVRLVLPPYTVHFKSPTYLQPSTLDLLDKKVCKETLKITAQDVGIREAIGRDPKFWPELQLLLKAAIPSLERRCFSIWDPSSVDYESTSGSLIAANYPGLWRDLERINDLISITRNVLTTGAVAQDLAASNSIDHEVFRLINCCVRVTARGYDGDAGTGEEEKWQWIVNAYKKLLNTCLMFLNNLVARNELRKLDLWVALFEGPGDIADVVAPAAAADVERERQMAIREKTQPEIAKMPAVKPNPPINGHDILLAYGLNGQGSRVSPIEYQGAVPLFKSQGFHPLPPRAAALLNRKLYDPNGFVYFTHVNQQNVIQRYQQDHKRSPSLGEIHRAIPSLWEAERQRLNLSENKMWDRWTSQYAQALTDYRRALDAFEKGEYVPPLALKQAEPKELPAPVSESPMTKPAAPQSMADKINALKEQLRDRYTAELKAAAESGDGDACRTITEGLESLARDGISDDQSVTSVKNDDLHMAISAETGRNVLSNGKEELMKKLEGYTNDDLHPDEANTSRELVAVGGNHHHHRRRRSAQSISDAFAPDSLGSEDEDEEESDEDEDDYPGSSEDGRGLLTDVPLILGPSEIEVLPMLVMSALVPAPTTVPLSDTDATLAGPGFNMENRHTLRTHILLSQTAGRNLLRELLIFVAAWDLREQELYFKFMIQIMEAILKNGLMPYAYHAFRDRSRSKDIISPAQAVIIKMLTCIFRVRNESAKKPVSLTPSQAAAPAAGAFQAARRVDLHILNFIFTEFRQHIIPQTCALIFLQGQIHQGRASPEDFPLNLWDMERMYEGVYQFLEFFAVLAEEQVAGTRGSGDGKAGGGIDAEGGKVSWKSILAEWEMASELVTLLRELENGIPKTMAMPPPAQQAQRRVSSQPPPPPQRSLSADAALITSPNDADRPFDSEGSALSRVPSRLSNSQIFEAETPLAYPEDPLGPQSMHDQDEPSDFEWRNLKKLTVLVLSSLVWKNKKVQDQVRNSGGLEALVDCCRPDEHNPYIREHAIMCLRFAVEGNEENADVIRKMGALREQQQREAVPRTGRTGGGGLLQSSDSSTLLQDDNNTRPSVPKEVLDKNGYETFMDEKGQVGLRRKDGVVDRPASTPAAGVGAAPPPPPPPPPPSGSASGATPPALSATSSNKQQPKASGSSSSSGGAKMTAEKAAEIMQNALRDLPVGDKLVTNRQKAEILTKLDRAFENSEKALGGKKG